MEELDEQASLNGVPLGLQLQDPVSRQCPDPEYLDVLYHRLAKATHSLCLLALRLNQQCCLAAEWVDATTVTHRGCCRTSRAQSLLKRDTAAAAA